MKRKTLVVLMVFLFIVAFSGCDGGGGNPTEPTTSTSGDSDLMLVKKYNADYAGGRTVRWDKDTITVYDTTSARGLQQDLDDWSQYLGGRRLVISGSGSDIEISADNSLSACGNTSYGWDSGYRIVKAYIKIRCRENTTIVKHEIGHAVGFFGHTSDGGVMDYENRRPTVTNIVARTLRKLYSLSPGTKIT